MSPPVHATVVARWSGGTWRAVLLRGPSGAGKSDLALRLMSSGWRLVADDYTHLGAFEGRLLASAPASIAGRMEARGVGLLAAGGPLVAEIRLVVDLVDGEPERMPELERVDILGVSMPHLHLNPRHASAGEKVAAAIRAL